MDKQDFITACRGVHPNIITEPGFWGTVDAHYGVRLVATYFPMTQDARIYTNEDEFDYVTCDEVKDFEDTLRTFIDNTPDEYFNDEDYVLDSLDIINAHD